MSKIKEKLTLEPFDPSQGRRDSRCELSQVARLMSNRIKVGKPLLHEDYLAILKFAWVPIKKCFINYKRQRHVEPKHVQNLYDNWDIIFVTPLRARYDAKTDRYYIADGMHHAIAWCLKYGPDSLVPVFYVESDDENMESKTFLTLNTKNIQVARYFIHTQNVIMGDPDAVALENCVQNAGCTTNYKKRVAGTITHFPNLEQARDKYGLDNLGFVLTKMRQYWPTEKIHTVSMLGFLKVKSLMEEHKTYTDSLFEDVFFHCIDFFEDCKRMELDITEQFKLRYNTNHLGMGVREKMASGILNVYEKATGKTLAPMPFEIDMPVIKATA